MKKLAILIFIFLGLFLILFAFTETHWGKNVLKNALVQSLKRSGIEVEAETFTGNLPKEMDLTNVRIGYNGATIHIDRLHIELSLLPLLVKEVSVKNITADGVRLSSLPTLSKTSSIALNVQSFQIHDLSIPSWRLLQVSGTLKQIRSTLSGKAHVDSTLGSMDLTLNRSRSGKLSVHADVISGPLKMGVDAKGFFDHFSGKISGSYEDITFKSRIQKKPGGPIRFQKLSAIRDDLGVQGDLIVNPDGQTFSSHWNLKTKIFNEPITSSGEIHGCWERGRVQGNLSAVSSLFEEKWNIQTPFQYEAKKLTLDQLVVESGLGNGTGSLVWNSAAWSGTFASTLNLALFPSFNGVLTSTITLNKSLEVSGAIKEFSYDGLYAKEVSIKGFWNQNVDVRMDQVKYKWVVLDKLSFTSAKTQDHWLFDVTGTGSHLTVDADGFFGNETIALEHAFGTYQNTSFDLEAPAFLNWSSGFLTVKSIALTLGSGNVYFSLEPEKVQLHTSQFPLELLRIPARGNLDLDFAFDHGEGNLTANVEKGEVLSENEEFIPTRGKLEAVLHRNRSEVEAHFAVKDTEIASLQCDLPIHFQLWPPTVDVEMARYATGTVKLQGKIEEVLNYFNLGMHRLEGTIDCELDLNGTLATPRVEGYCKIAHGAYENYLTGTELTHLSAEWKADRQRLQLVSMKARDAKKKGQLIATGEITLSIQDKLPFHFDLAFNRLDLVQIDLINAEAEGKLTIEGNLSAALAKGSIEVIESDISIPDKISRSYPELQVVYKHGAPASAVSSWTAPKIPYPLELDVDITAPEGVFIDGRGLHSEWKGRFHIGGTFTSPSAQGKLELMKGEFLFTGRRFKLLEGALFMKGKPYEMPSISISANTSEKGMSITAHLYGPLNKPQLTFQSSPPLPMTGILSYLLFGKDLSEVSGIQALQLASTIATVAGEAPDILEMTRKSLGIDRLQIVLTPTGAEGEETISLQVGKVIFPGFLVLVRQGADDKTPNIAIEVDLTHGFTFEAESQQQPSAQGKFSLKWNLNY